MSLLALILATAPFANAAPETNDMRVALRGAAESWADASIAAVYRGGALASGAAIVAPVYGPLSLDIEFMYRRLEDDREQQLLELLPASVLVELDLGQQDGAYGFVAAGPSFVTFREGYPTPKGREVITGARGLFEARGGVRIDLGLMQPSLTGTGSPIKAVELELYGGRRIQRASVAGFNFSAWRAGMGVALVL